MYHTSAEKVRFVRVIKHASSFSYQVLIYCPLSSTRPHNILQIFHKVVFFIFFSLLKNTIALISDKHAQSSQPEPIVNFLMCNISPLGTAELYPTSAPEAGPEGYNANVCLCWLMYCCLAAAWATVFAHFWLTFPLNLIMLVLTLYGWIFIFGCLYLLDILRSCNLFTFTIIYIFFTLA